MPTFKLMYIEKTELIGLSLPFKTTNEKGQSSIDCGILWQKFENENFLEKIPDKLSNEIYAVYHKYDGDYSNPYSYFIGCKVKPGTNPPNGMSSCTLMNGKYFKKTAKGKIPDCITQVWMDIWNSDLKRAYQTDFEIYDARSKDWANAEVDIFVSVLSE